MSLPIIEIKNLSKQYHRTLNTSGRYNSLRDVLSHPLQALKNRKNVEKTSFWALDDISFDVNQGEVVGIIGRNGAGKSTLLKIISRITAPTKGSITLRGRVGSLLEVGTGFHPELTGRENVFMNGAILGMSHREIRQKFDEIVDFSGVGAFIDTPVKRYSSGMNTRLAFAVAAHLDPEILIVDEVLAVGDYEFQKKSLGKMKDVAKSGRTVLFVSHNMNAVRQLCNRGVYLRNSKIVADSNDIDGIVGQYLTAENNFSATGWQYQEGGFTDPECQPLAFYVSSDKESEISRPVTADEQIYINVICDVQGPAHKMAVGYTVQDDMGNSLYWTHNLDVIDKGMLRLQPGRNHVIAPIPVNLLNDNEYTISLFAGIPGERSIMTPDDSPIKIKLSVFGNTLRSSYWNTKRSTIIAPTIEWRKI